MRSRSATTWTVGSGSISRPAGIEDAPKETPLFRSALGKQKQLTARPLSANSMGLMLKRRLKDAGLPPVFSPHSFRVLVVTDLLSQDVPLEDVQYLAGHANPRTTQIYDRRRPARHPQYCGEDFRVRGSDRGDRDPDPLRDGV